MFHQMKFSEKPRFRTSAEVYDALKAACENNSDIAEFIPLGKSEGGRPIAGAIIGSGNKTISLLAGAHSDEPVGPETLRNFILEGLRQRRQLSELFEKYRFVIIPHINPDGEAANRTWIAQWPDLAAYLQHTFRELPGRDLEFGYPEMRIENRLVSALLAANGPLHLHASLHGMAFSEGAFLLIERHWIERTTALQEQFIAYAKQLGMRLHNHDRNGEKGFLYIGPGFTTTPEGRAMQAYFREQNDEATARLFHLSSMEFVRGLGGDPLCLVSELPLFDIRRKMGDSRKNLPAAYLAFKERRPEILQKIASKTSLDGIIREFDIQPLDLETAIRYQLYIITLGLQAIAA